MPLQSSGAISLSQIQTEFGGSNPISLSEYYSAASGIPSSGTISMNQFYGKSGGPDDTYFYTYFNGSSTVIPHGQAYNTWLNLFRNATSATTLYFYFGSTSTKPAPTYTVTVGVQNYRTAVSGTGTYGSGTATSPYIGRGCGNHSTNTSGLSSVSWHFNNTVSCACHGGAPVIRPHIGNLNWGGINGGCNQPAQYMGIGFI